MPNVRLTPTLSPLWDHCCTNRLNWPFRFRKAYLLVNDTNVLFQLIRVRRELEVNAAQTESLLIPKI